MNAPRMTIPEKLFSTAYAAALRLYPAAFRAKYSRQMMDTVRASWADSPNRPRLAATLVRDLAASLPREHWRAVSPARPGYVVAFAAFFSLLLGAVSVVNQQILRLDADRIPVSLVNSSADRIAHGADPAPMFAGTDREISSPAWLHSASFIGGLYNSAGEPVVGNATLHGALPRPPAGIFRTARARGLFKVTWQPEPKVRVALAIRALPDGTFVLGGQSLIPSETREIRFHTFLLWMWLAMIAATIGISLAYRARHTTEPA